MNQKIFKVAKINGKFILIDPNGIIIEFDNIVEFCRKYKLFYISIHRVLSGRNFHTQGWRKYDEKLIGVPFDKKAYNSLAKQKIVKHYKFKNELDGRIVEGDGIARFARSEGIDHSPLVKVLKGKIRAYKGWTFCN